MKPTRLLSLVSAVIVTGQISMAQEIAPSGTQSTPAGKEELEIGDPKAVEEGRVELDPGLAPVPSGAESVPLAEEKLTLPGLEGLPKEKLATIEKNIGEIAACMQGPRMQEALSLLFDTEELIGKEYFLVENMRGAVYTKMRDFENAREHFTKAIELTKSNPDQGFHPRFNLAEIEFVQGNYDQAIERFRKLAQEKSEAAVSTKKLMEFKILVSQIKLGKRKEAEAVLATFDPLDNDSPAYYFAQAALAYAEDDRDEADGWRASAGRIYPQSMNDIYKDSLVEAGWIQTLQ